MSISKMIILVGNVNGGASGVHTDVDGGECHEIRGKVEKSTLLLGKWDMPSSTLVLQVGGHEYKLEGAGLPRINVGEEVILHSKESLEWLEQHVFPQYPSVDYSIVGLQVISDGESIFRLVLPNSAFSHGIARYAFAS